MQIFSCLFILLPATKAGDFDHTIADALRAQDLWPFTPINASIPGAQDSCSLYCFPLHCGLWGHRTLTAGAGPSTPLTVRVRLVVTPAVVLGPQKFEYERAGLAVYELH
jgi:hypothetical protein